MNIRYFVEFKKFELKIQIPSASRLGMTIDLELYSIIFRSDGSKLRRVLRKDGREG